MPRKEIRMRYCGRRQRHDLKQINELVFGHSRSSPRYQRARLIEIVPLSPPCSKPSEPGVCWPSIFCYTEITHLFRRVEQFFPQAMVEICFRHFPYQLDKIIEDPFAYHAVGSYSGSFLMEHRSQFAVVDRSVSIGSFFDEVQILVQSASSRRIVITCI